MARATAWFISLTYDFHKPGVSCSLGHGLPAAVNISLRHATFIFLSKTKVYGYNIVYYISIIIIKLAHTYLFQNSKCPLAPMGKGSP